MSSCENDQNKAVDCCGDNKKKSGLGWILWIGLIGVSMGYFLHLIVSPAGIAGTFSGTVYRLMNQMWIGLALGILALGFIGKVPQNIVQGFMGRGGTFSGTLRACAAGLFLDLCNHGILMVAAKLYERGVSYGQVLAFLIASPWNSLSLTLILFSLIGLKWTILFIAGSAVVAVLTGWMAALIIGRSKLPDNPNSIELDENFSLKKEIRESWSKATFNTAFFRSAIFDGICESRMIARWLLLGILMAACLATFVPEDAFSTWFGPTIIGLFATLTTATIIEVCSEGSVPIAAELLTRADAPGNSFTFLMAGAATDYTEIAILRDVTGSWKLTFLLPFLALPQILILGVLFNQAAG